MTVTLSYAGARFIEAHEGFVAHPYNDSENNATIAIGHLLHIGPVTAADRLHWGTITLARALQLLQLDAKRTALAPLQESLRVALTVAQVDALCSLAFNCGPRSLRVGGSVMVAVNSKPRIADAAKLHAWHDRVAAAFMLWAHPEVLTRRRRSEVVLFRTGKYTKRAGNEFANA